MPNVDAKKKTASSKRNRTRGANASPMSGLSLGSLPSGESQEGRSKDFSHLTGTIEGMAPARSPEAVEGSPSSETEGAEVKGPIYLIKAKKIRDWYLNDRSAASLEHDPKFALLTEEIRAVGQTTPILVRPLDAADDEGHEYEQVAGFRRLAACRKLNPSMDVRCVVSSMTDTEALALQSSENKGRSAPTVWDLSVHFQRIYDKEMAKPEPRNKQQVADILRETRSKFSSYMGFAESMEIDLVRSLHLTRLGYDAIKLLAVDVSRYEGSGAGDRQDLVDRVVESADKINDGDTKRVPALLAKILKDYAESVAPAAAGKDENRTRSYRSKAGKTLSVRRGGDKLTFDIHSAALSMASDDELEAALVGFLESKGVSMEASD